MPQRDAYHRFPQQRSPVLGLLGLANAIITCIFPMGLLYLVFLPCGDKGCRTAIPSVVNTTQPSVTPAIAHTTITTKPADDGKQLLVSNVTQATNDGQATAGNDYQIINGKRKSLVKGNYQNNR